MPHSEPPPEDLRLIEEYCERMWGPEHHHQVRGEAHVEGPRVTLCERRTLGQAGDEPIHETFAQLRYRAKSSDWALYWADRNSRWHEYRQGGIFTGSVTALLDEIDDDPTFIFKG